MQTEETKKKKKETPCCGFGEAFKEMRGICEKMGAYGPPRSDSTACAGMMQEMMKGKMQKRCRPETGRKPDGSES